MHTSNKKNLLIIEDDLHLLEFLKDIFEASSWDVSVAPTGREGLAALVGGKLPDLILLDLNLPDFNGMEILKIVSDKKLNTAVLVMTGEGTIQKAVEATKLGADDFLQKPLSPEVLLDTVEKIMAKRQGQWMSKALLPPPRDQPTSKKHPKRPRGSPSTSIIVLGFSVIAVIVGTVFFIFFSSKDAIEQPSNEQKISAKNRRNYFYSNQLQDYYCKEYLQKSCDNQSLNLNPFSREISPLQDGTTLYHQYCDRCHGNDGQGNGRDAVHLETKPGRLEFAGHGVLEKDNFLFWTIAEGGIPLNTDMPAFKNILTENELWKLVLYLEFQ